MLFRLGNYFLDSTVCREYVLASCTMTVFLAIGKLLDSFCLYVWIFGVYSNWLVCQTLEHSPQLFSRFDVEVLVKKSQKNALSTLSWPRIWLSIVTSWLSNGWVNKRVKSRKPLFCSNRLLSCRNIEQIKLLTGTGHQTSSGHQLFIRIKLIRSLAVLFTACFN